jgi:hypothetical protein
LGGYRPSNAVGFGTAAGLTPNRVSLTKVKSNNAFKCEGTPLGALQVLEMTMDDSVMLQDKSLETHVEGEKVWLGSSP